MQVHAPSSLPLALLKPAEYALKQPISAHGLATLRASLAELGFSSVFNVASDADGTYAVLDGNSRLEELRACGATHAPCIVREDMAHTVPDHPARRLRFVMAFDAFRKRYDKGALLTSITDLIASGHDGKVLAKLSGLEHLDKIIADASKASSKGTDKGITPPSLDSIVLMGPAEQIAGIRRSLELLRGHMTVNEQVTALLDEAHASLPVGEAFLTVFLSALLLHRGSP